MSDSAQYDQIRQKIIAHLNSVGGKGVDTIGNIAKATGVKRRELSKVINQMELNGEVEASGVMAGVAGYKLKK
jgi:DNA-binding MarR family transcriptional regulator